MKKLLPLVAFSVLLLVPAGVQNAFAQGDLFGCGVTPGPFSSGQLFVLDETDGSTISNQDITLGGADVDGCNGLATHPTSGQVWIIVRDSGDRHLATINTSTGAATSVGILDDNYAGIAFAPDGTLYGITGDGASTPETLYILDKTDASSTFVLTLGNGDDGEVIAIDNECVLHHGSGISDGDRFYERIDLVTLTEIFSGQQTGPDVEDELTSMVFNPSTQRVLAGERTGPDFYDIDSTGVTTTLGTTDDTLKGLAFEQPFAGLVTDANCDGDLDTIAGEIIPIDATSLVIAGALSPAVWMISTFSALGIGAFVVARNPYNVRNIKVILQDYLDRL